MKANFARHGSLEGSAKTRRNKINTWTVATAVVAMVLTSSLIANAAPWGNGGAGSAGGASGTINSGVTGQLAYYPGNGAAISGATIGGDCAFSSPSNFLCTKTNGRAFAASATTDATNAANISSGTLSGARLPPPTSSTLGGVQAFTPVSHQWINGVSATGAHTSSQPAASDISGLAASATTDTTNAANITSGTLAATQGGTGDPLGKALAQSWVIVAAGQTTAAGLLVRNVYGVNPNGTTVQTAAATDLLIRGVAQSNQTAGQSVLVTSWGPANCTFDNQNAVGDAVVNGTSGQCHDTGSSSAPAAGTELLGFSRTLNAGAGTSASVDFRIGMYNSNGCTVAKCITSATAVCGKGTANWTQVCSATIGPFQHPSGPGNVVIGIRGNAVLFQTGATPPTSADYRVFASNCNGGSNADLHGIPSVMLTANTNLLIPVLGEVTLAAKDAMYPNGCSIEFDCAEGSSDATGALKVFSGSTDSNGANVSSSVEFMACPGDNL